MTETARLNREAGIISTILGAGLLTCVLVVIPEPSMGPERYALPKEAVTHASAWAAVTSALICFRLRRLGLGDALLIAFLIVGTASALVGATNPAVAFRSLSLWASGVALYWSACVASENGGRRSLELFLCLAIVVIAMLTLAETYAGLPIVGSSLFPPAGTLGNRNRAAAAIVVGLPILALSTLKELRRIWAQLGIVAFSVCIGAILVCRSRAAWIAVAVEIAVATYVSVRRRRRVENLSILPKRLLSVTTVSVAVCVCVAVLPNRLRWQTSSPLRESLETLVEFHSGSGLARINIAQTTLRMVALHPWLGVAPGHWAIRYSRYAGPADSSLVRDGNVNVNRLPLEDWLGIAAEFGIPASAFLGVFLVTVLWPGRIASSHELLAVRSAPSLPITMTVFGVLVLGLFEPVLETPVALFLTMIVLGAYAGTRRQPGRLSPHGRRQSKPNVALLIGVVATFGFCSCWWTWRLIEAAQLLYVKDATTQTLEHAVRINGYDYVARMRLAEALYVEGRCDLAEAHIRAAMRLAPDANRPRLLEEACRERDLDQ